MFFLTFYNADLQFAEKELTWRIHITEKAFPTTCQVKIFNRKKIAKAVLDENVETLIVYISSLRSKMSLYLAREIQLALLLTKKVTVSIKYSDFANVFLQKSANILSKRTGVNKHKIKLEKGKQTPYWPIYSLEPVEVEILKIYIKTNRQTVLSRYQSH